jgi:hypothetical protein
MIGDAVEPLYGLTVIILIVAKSLSR